MQALPAAILIALASIFASILTSPASAADIHVMAAGSLKEAFTAIFADYGKKTGDSFTPVWGPSGELRKRLQNGEAFDIFASAALPHAQVLTEAGLSGPSVMFVRNTLCVVTEASRPLDTQNLVETLLKPEIRIGTATPVADPAGDYTWEIFRKIDATRPGAYDMLSKKAQQLFGGPTNSTPINGRPRPLVALDAREIDLFFTYCSSAQQIVHDSATYKAVGLPGDLSVAAEFGLTVSRHATGGASDFAMYLLSSPAQATLQAFGFVPVTLPAAP
jgi:ABC-type molybdate transport system substrate-binding protein